MEIINFIFRFQTDANLHIIIMLAADVANLPPHPFTTIISK